MKDRRHYTVEDYLALEAAALERSEYYQGKIFPRDAGTRAHSLITVNLTASLGTQLRGKPWEIYSSDIKVSPLETVAFFYPDLSITCSEPIFKDEKQTILLNPSVIVEILLPATEEFDREEKFAAYAQVASLTDYILIAQHKPWIEHFAREGQGGKWVYQTATDRDGALEIASIGCRLVLSDVYDRIAFTAAR